MLAGEGPCGLIICPSRELARQTFEVIEGYTQQLANAGYPQLHTLLCIGGIDMKAQTDQFKHAGMQKYHPLVLRLGLSHAFPAFSSISPNNQQSALVTNTAYLSQLRSMWSAQFTLILPRW